MQWRIGPRRARTVLGVGILAMLVCAMLVAVLGNVAGASDNVDCPEGVPYTIPTNPLQGLSTGQSAVFEVNGAHFTITKILGDHPFEDDSFDWQSDREIDAVLVKGGQDTNVYVYAGFYNGSNLHPPLNGGGQAPVISHVVSPLEFYVHIMSDDEEA